MLGNNKRTSEFERNEVLEQVLEQAKNIIFEDTNGYYKKQQDPLIVYIVGCPRSGTTLLHQVLCNTGGFAYPSNIASRFYTNTYLGGIITRLLTDKEFDFKKETLIEDSIDYYSDIGKTKGPISPNAFWYFWREYLEFSDNIIDLDKSDVKGFITGLHNMSMAFDYKPVVLKGAIANFSLNELKKITRNFFFVYSKRNFKDNAESIMNARKRQYGNEKIWWSFPLKDMKSIQKLNPSEQVECQVMQINNEVESFLERISSDRKVTIAHEEFCMYPLESIEKITEKIRLLTGKEVGVYNGPIKFKK